MSFALDAQVLSHRITSATKTTVDAEGRQIVEKAPISFVDIDRNSNAIFLIIKGQKPIEIIYDEERTVANSSVCKEKLYKYEMKDVCEWRVVLDSKDCQIKIFADDNVQYDLSGKSIEAED